MPLRVKSSKSSFRSICCSWKCSNTHARYKNVPTWFYPLGKNSAFLSKRCRNVGKRRSELAMQIKQFQTEVALSLDACRSKCVSRRNRCSKMLQVGSPNHGSVHTEMWQSMVPSNLCVPNGSSLLAPSSTHIARRPSIQMRLLCAQIRSRSTSAEENAFLMCSDALSSLV